METTSQIEELFPGLGRQLEKNIQPQNWEYKNSKLFNIKKQEYMYEYSEVSDFEHEKHEVKKWLQSIDCFQSADMLTTAALINDAASRFSKLGFSSLDQVNLRNIHDTGNDLHTQWTCQELRTFIINKNISLKDSTNDYSNGLLVVYGLFNLSLITEIATQLKPRIVIIFEPDMELISLKVNNQECEDALAKLESINCDIFLISDDNPDKAFLQATGIAESVNLLCQECLFTISLRNDEFFERIDSKYKSNESSLLKTIGLFGFFVDEIHMIMNSSITFTQNPPRIISYKSFSPNDTHAVITASGPSLEKNLPLLSQYRNKYHLLCCYSTLGALVKNDLKPDYHCNQERHCLHLPMLADPVISKLVKDIILICSANNDPRMNSIYHDTAAIFRSASCPSALFARDTGDIVDGEGNQVANLALVSAILLGYKTIHLFGVDLGAAKKSEGRSNKALIYDKNQPRVFDKKRPGNLGNEVWVDDGLIDSAQYMSNLLNGLSLPDKSFIEGLTVYNYGEGQQIKGAISAKPDSFHENIENSDSNSSSKTIFESLDRYDVQTARARFVAFDWRNRLEDYLAFAQKCIEEPFNPCTQELFFERTERYFNVLSHQVMSRLMSGSLLKSWFFIIKVNSFMPDLTEEQRQEWESECKNILKISLKSMESLTLEMLDHVENLEDLSGHDFISLGYHPKS